MVAQVGHPNKHPKEVQAPASESLRGSRRPRKRRSGQGSDPRERDFGITWARSLVIRGHFPLNPGIGPSAPLRDRCRIQWLLVSLLEGVADLATTRPWPAARWLAGAARYPQGAAS
jgi:hypothetical protein